MRDKEEFEEVRGVGRRVGRGRRRGREEGEGCGDSYVELMSSDSWEDGNSAH